MSIDKTLEKRIDELKAELINQYLLVFKKHHDMLEIFEKIHVHINISSEKEIKTQKQLVDAIKKIEMKNLNKQSDYESFQVKSIFTENEFNEIYQIMLMDMDNPRYADFSQKYNYSVQDLLTLLDQIVSLSSVTHEMQAKDANSQFERIFYQYVEMDTIRYGIENPDLKKTIDKTRVILGSRMKLRAEKQRILKQLLLDESKKNGRWKSVYQAVKNCMDEIERAFESFDTAWINQEIEISKSKIIMLKDRLELSESPISIKKANKQILDIEQWISQLKQALKKGYPYEDLQNFLPFNTSYSEELIMRIVKNDKSLMDEIIVKKVCTC